MARLRLALVALLPAAAMLAACDPVVEGPDGGDVDRFGDEELDDEVSDDDGDESAGDDDPDAEPDPGPGSDPGSDPDGPLPEPEPKPDAAVPCDWDAPWDGYACTDEDGVEGTNHCLIVDDEELWTECSTEEPECVPGEGFDQGCLGELCYWDGEALVRHYWSEPNCNTPLVLSFDGAPVEFSAASAASFDLSTDGTCLSTDWPTAPWLALDRDGDGFIRDGSELFGNATKMATGGHAEHGFAALAELDTNRDGKISAVDERFSELVLWSDFDTNRIGAYAELRPLTETSVVSIDLGFGLQRSCDRRGNCGFERASFEYRTPEGSTGVGEVVDVHVACH